MESRDIKTEGEASNGSLISALTTVKRVSDIDSVRQDKENKTKRQREREEKPRERRRKRRKQKPEDNHQYQFLIQSLELDGVNIGGAIRKVEPYPFTYTTFCKARWIGKSLLDIYHSEFGAYPRVSWYKMCLCIECWLNCWLVQDILRELHPTRADSGWRQDRGSILSCQGRRRAASHGSSP